MSRIQVAGREQKTGTASSDQQTGRADQQIGQRRGAKEAHRGQAKIGAQTEARQVA